MDHNLTEYRVVVTGDRCGRTRTYTVRSAWMDVIVAAAIASGLKPTTADTQGATVAVQRRAEAAPAEGEVLQARTWEPVRYELGTTVDYPLPLPPGEAPPLTEAQPAAAESPPPAPAAPDPNVAFGTIVFNQDEKGWREVVSMTSESGKVSAYAWRINDSDVQEPDPQPGHYYVTAQDGDRSWHVCGPWPTHVEALAALADVCAYAGQRDPRAAFMGWGTGRLGLEHAPIKALVQVAELEAARARWAEEAAERAQPPRARRAEPDALTMRGRAPRKAAKARKGAKESAGTSEAGEGSQGQPEAAGEVPGTAPAAARAESATTATHLAAEGSDG